MAEKAPEYLSAEELRNRLYHSLRNRGLVNTIKSQLRTNLISELQQSVQGPLTLRDLEPTESDPLLLRAANSLVADHLGRLKYEYSLGVFLPESGLAQDKIFHPDDLMKLLHISPESRLYKKILKSGSQSEKGLLWKILSELSALHARATQDDGTQVDLTRSGPIVSLDAKLHCLEELYSSKRDDLARGGKSAVEERLLNYQRQLEDRYNTQLKLELARMKDAEIARMQLEEKEVGRKELEKQRRELQRAYQDKYDALLLRERNSMERLQKEQELQEKEVYSQRQMLLADIESIRQREAEVKREAEAYKREKQLMDERNKAKEEELHRREVELRNKEIQFEQRLHNEMAQFKLDQQAKFIDRVQNVEVREAKVKQEERMVAEEKSKIQALKDEVRDKTHRINNLESALQEAKHSEVTATRQNEFINSKLRDMADYKTLREQNVAMRNELETLRTRLSELLNMNERERGRQEELLRELRRPSPETLMLQRDLERARENLRQEQVVYEQQKQLLESRLKDEVDRNRDLVQRLEEQVLQMKEMNREVVDLHRQLAMTQTVLNNEIYRKPRDEAGTRDRSQLNLSRGGGDEIHVSHHSVRVTAAELDPRGTRGPLTFAGDKDIYNDVDSDLDFVPATRQRRLSNFSDDHSSAASADIVAETRYRLKGLEKEAQNLERAYHDFHCQMTNVSALPAEPPPRVINQPPPAPQGSSSGHRHMESPPHSPIPHERPLSSTPYNRRRPDPSSRHDDSFAELSGRRSKQEASRQLHFDLSHVSDEEDGKLPLETKHVRSRPITVADLEARPGSPSMLVVGESESSSPPAARQDDQRSLVKQDPFLSMDQPPSALPPMSLDAAWPRPSVSTPLDVAEKQPDVPLDNAWKQPDVPLDTAWKQPAVSLDENWQTGNAKTSDEKLELDKRRVEEEKIERRRREEVEVEQRKQQEEGEQKEKDEAAIDPVMLEYMARVQAMKSQEEGKQPPEASDKNWSQSEEISGLEPDEKSEAVFDDVWG